MSEPNKIIAANLLRWYCRNARNLPWRKTKDPYKIWISEVMLQQTTVKTVIPYYEGWIKTFPAVQEVARASLQKVLRIWQGLGYYSRAKNIHKCAKIFAKKYNARIPKNPEILNSLPGFGPYTTGAVLSIAYDYPIPIIDANVRRVMMRLMKINGYSLATQDKKIWPVLMEILPQKYSGDFNQALMEVGALICKSNEPLCEKCPLKNQCEARKDGIQDSIPRVKASKIQRIKAVVGVIEHQGKILIQKRTSGNLFAGLWEFPGGKIEEREQPHQALKRELMEELGCQLQSFHRLTSLKHYYTKFCAHLDVFQCTLKGQPVLSKNRRYVSLKNMGHYPMPSASVRIIKKLKSI